jgi:hypothetical protein
VAAVVPSLLKLVGEGFTSDAYAADGNHLRWMFEPRLGFPRLAFCLERRPSLLDERGLAGVPVNVEDFRLAPGQQPEQPGIIVRTDLAVSRDDAPLSQDQFGVALAAEPLVVDFHGGSGATDEPQACFVRLVFLVRTKGRLTAEALYVNRGDPEVVDRAIHPRRLIDPGLRHDRVLVADAGKVRAFAERLQRPDLQPLPPKLTQPDEKALYARLVASSQAFRLIKATYVKGLLASLKELGLRVSDLLPDLSIPVRVDIVLSADRIDRVSIVGRAASLATVTWVRTEDLVEKGKWETVGCYPIATDEPGYVADNAAAFGGSTGEDLAKVRVVDLLPHGVEPLDDPVVPPVRPPTPDELIARYLDTWSGRLEPWVRRVLADSGPHVHQSEVTISGPLTDGGHRPGERPAGLDVRPTSLQIAPYEFVLAAAAAFRTAMLLGLGAVDVHTEERAWDYRVRGRWRLDDVLAWGVRLQRRIADLIDEMTSATPSRYSELLGELLVLVSESVATAAFLSEVRTLATDGVLELFGLVLGVQLTGHGLFAGPAGLAARDDGLGTPPESGAAPEGVVALEWPLRGRARVVMNEAIPMGAAIGRDDLDRADPMTILNPRTDPAGGPAVAIVPAGPIVDPGAAGQAVFRDRHASNGVLYGYGVSECDPFGRWSAFTETEFRWVRRIPPRPPVDVEATLSPSGPTFRLAVGFSWPIAARPDDHDFRVHVRRDPPPPSDPVRRGAGTGWDRAERTAGTEAGSYLVDGTGTGAAGHDGMTVTVAPVLEPAAEGGPRRRFVVTFDGLVLARDARDRAIAFVGVSAVNADGDESDDVGGPARAEHVIADPPPAPGLPAEPLRSTFADAQGRSTIALRWLAAAGRRHVVFRAGEREVAQMAADVLGPAGAYDPTQPLAARALRLRDLAQSTRLAFQPCSPRLDPGIAEYVADLPGHIRTLTVYTVLAESPGGVLSGWPTTPDHFAAVVVPEALPPARPTIIRAAWRDAATSGGVAVPAGAELTIAEPPTPSSIPPGNTAEVVAYEVFRTRHADRTDDVRRMRPVGQLANPTFVVDDSLVDDTPGRRAARVVRFVDPTVAPWTRYFYRLVARAEGGSGPGTRSEPSAPVRVDTVDPADPSPPVVLGHAAVGLDVEVRFQAVAPDNPVGPFRFEVARIAPTALTVGRFVAQEVRESGGTGDTFRITFPRALLVPEASLPTDIRFVVRIVDPLGRRTPSSPVVHTGS